ncbi:MAG: ATP synthase subunit I [Pseudomonadales bacterium]|nr:ATP synthase subunit I [Pseudomonadales bacterium]
MRVINQKQRDIAKKTVVLQCIVAVLLGLFALLLKDKDFAISVSVGAGISFLANAYFAAKVFRYSGARLSQQIAQSFYSAEAGKFAITVVFFAIAFKWLEVLKEPSNAGAMLLAFFVVQTTAWFVPLLGSQLRSNKKRNK